MTTTLATPADALVDFLLANIKEEAPPKIRYKLIGLEHHYQHLFCDTCGSSERVEDFLSIAEAQDDGEYPRRYLRPSHKELPHLLSKLPILHSEKRESQILTSCHECPPRGEQAEQAGQLRLF